MSAVRLSESVGIWGKGPWLDPARRSEAVEAAAEAEELGFGSLWLSAGHEGEGLPAVFGDLLGGTRRLTVASGILSIWRSTPEQSRRSAADLEDAYPGRFILGLGASNRARAEALGHRYDRPFTAIVEYLDELDRDEAGGDAVSAGRRVLAALGPRMTRLSAERAAGMHSYFVPVEHTAAAREILGETPLLVPELAVVLTKDADTARATVREHMAYYLALPSYSENLRRLGWSDDDLRDAGSDRLVDAIVAWGDPDAIRTRVDAHRAAGADTVLIQVLQRDAKAFPSEQLRELAPALIDR